MLDAFVNRILEGDCIDVLKILPDETVDMVFADPPYFMQLENTLMRYEGTVFNGMKDSDWDKFNDFKHYDKFCIDWLKECKRVLKKNGSLWVIGSFQNIYRVGTILLDLGFWIMNDVIWEKSNPVPNFSGVRFTNAHETLLWVVKNKKAKPTFNYKTMKTYNGGKQMRSVWKIPLCVGSERLKNSEGQKLHNTQKPEELLRRVILSTTKKGDIVLDPFFGTGTTGFVAKTLGRQFIGIEKEQEYIEAAQQRLEKAVQVSLEWHEVAEEKVSRVPFSALFEEGLVFEGEYLYSKNKDHSAILNRDGKVTYGNEVLSIHIASAKALNKINNNGWTYWHVLRDGQLILIDALRKKYREEHK